MRSERWRAPLRASQFSQVFSFLLPHMRPERAKMALASALGFLSAAFSVLSALLMASMLEVIRSRAVPVARPVELTAALDLNRTGQQAAGLLGLLLEPLPDIESVIVVLGGLLIVTTAGAVLTNAVSHWLWVRVRLAMVMRLRVDLFSHLLALPLSFHVLNRAGTLLARLEHDVGDMSTLVPVVFGTLLRSPFVLGAALLAMIQTSLALTGIAVLAGASFVAANAAMGRLVRTSHLQRSVVRGDLLSIMQEALLSIRIIKTFGAEHAEIRDLRNRLNALASAEIRNDALTAQIPQGLGQLMSVFAITVVAVAGLRMVTAGSITEQGLLLFTVTSVAMLATSAASAQALVNVFALSASASRVLDLWRARSDVDAGTRVPPGFAREIRLDGVRFGYGDSFQVAIDSLVIRKGEFVAIVGRSGSGKSTLVDLILRLQEPASGSIRLDGVDIREFSQRAYRRLFGVVSQETLLFHDTVRNNIVYGREGVDDDEVREAGATANADGFISRFPDSYSTLVGERGARLSGGERQRIAIARALIGHPPILVFDEATSALDAESERLVQDAIDHVSAERTGIVIAHRASTVRRADRIVVMDAGRALAVGTHEELMATCDVYRRLQAETADPVLVGAVRP